MTRGVLACVLAGAIWGGIFVGPRILPQYDALTFSLAQMVTDAGHFSVTALPAGATNPAAVELSPDR